MNNKIEILQTKLFRPELPPDFIERTMIIEILQDNHHTHPVILMSAPAGYGKSTILSAWLQQCKHLSSWYSLDETDNDLRVFLKYLFTAIQKRVPNLGKEILQLMNDATLPHTNILSDLVINELTKIKEPFIFVMDDFHIITNQDIILLITKLINHPSKYFNLILATRHDPVMLPLNKYRAKGKMIDIRMEDLKFSFTETSQFLSSAISQSLDKEHIQKIFQNMEGWPAGLRLTSVSLSQNRNYAETLRHFDTNEYIMEYLFEDVLSSSPEPFKEYLFISSILDRFSMAACEALVDSATSYEAQNFISWLKQNNLFIVQLDKNGIWFRYHHLFKDLLREEFNKTKSKEEINKLYILAGHYFLKENLIEDSIRYYILAEEWGDAVCAFTSIRHQLMEKLRWQRTEYLLNLFPVVIIDKYPELLLSKAWLYDKQNKLDELFTILDQIKDLNSSNKNSKYEKDLAYELQILNGLKYVLRSNPKKALTELNGPIKHLSSNLYFLRAYAIMLSSIGLKMIGDLTRARKVVYDALGSEENDVIKVHCLYSLCFIDWLTADLKNLEQNASQLLYISEKNEMLEITTWARFYLGVLYYSKNQFKEATDVLESYERKVIVSAITSHAASIYILCSIKISEGESKEADHLLNKLMNFAFETNNKILMIETKAFRAEMALRQNDFGEALKWSRSFRFEKFEIAYTFYFPFITFIKVLIKEGTKESLKKGSKMISDAIKFYSEQNNLFIMIQLYSLQSLYFVKVSKPDEALESLKNAIGESEHSGHHRIFLDLGQEMYELFHKYKRLKSDSLFVDELMDLFEKEGSSGFEPAQASTIGKSFVNQLSNRELDVLKLLSQRFQNKEIASKLFISIPTVKRHTSNIYEKLNVNNRREAVDRAVSMKIIPSH